MTHQPSFMSRCAQRDAFPSVRRNWVTAQLYVISGASRNWVFMRFSAIYTIVTEGHGVVKIGLALRCFASHLLPPDRSRDWIKWTSDTKERYCFVILLYHEEFHFSALAAELKVTVFAVVEAFDIIIANGQRWISGLLSMNNYSTLLHTLYVCILPSSRDIFSKWSIEFINQCNFANLFDRCLKGARVKRKSDIEICEY